MKKKLWIVLLPVALLALVAATLPTGQKLIGEVTGRAVDLNADPSALTSSNGTTPVIKWDDSGAEVTGNLAVDTNTLFVDSADNRVGVGTANPATRLEISGDGYLNGLQLSGGDGGAAIPVRIHSDKDIHWDYNSLSGDDSGGMKLQTKYSDGTGRPILLNPSKGNVGIGTLDPQSLFSVNGSMEIGMGSTGYIRNYNGSRVYNGYLKLYDVGNGNVEIGTTSPSGDVNLIPGSTGGVGIGTTDPVEKLAIGGLTTAGDSYLYLGSEGGDVGYYKTGIKLRMHTSAYGFTLQNENISSSVNGFNIIRHNASDPGTSAFYIKLSNGYTGIGTTDPANLLHVVQTSASAETTPVLLSNKGNTNAAVALGFNAYNGTFTTGEISNKNFGAGNYGLLFSTYSNDDCVSIRNGRLGIQTTDPSYTLDVSGDARVTGKVIRPPLTFAATASNHVIPNTSSKVRLYSSTMGVTLGASSGDGPVIETAGAVDGQEITIYNAGFINPSAVFLAVNSNSNTWSRVISKDGNNIQLSYNSIGATAHVMQSASFTYDANSGFWVQK